LTGGIGIGITDSSIREVTPASGNTGAATERAADLARIGSSHTTELRIRVLHTSEEESENKTEEKDEKKKLNEPFHNTFLCIRHANNVPKCQFACKSWLKLLTRNSDSILGSSDL
jgi:hypothetical protein